MRIINNKKIIISLAISLLVGAAHAEKKADAVYQQELDRIAALDVSEQVQRDIEENRFQLFIYHNRGGTQLPGISEEAKQQLSSTCERVVMQDVGDVVYSQPHLKYLALYINYATEYNKQMQPFCIN